jgi:hypothetical protein
LRVVEIREGISSVGVNFSSGRPMMMGVGVWEREKMGSIGD